MSNRHADELWTLFQQGDVAAFYQLYDQYADMLYHYGTKFTGDQALVEDCLHDLFVELWDKRHQLQPIRSWKCYSFAALRRRIIRALQKDRKLTSLDASYDDFCQQEARAQAHLAQQQAVMHDQFDKVQRAIQALSPRQQEVIFLRYQDGFIPEEIAAIMSISRESVYKLMHKAIHAIKKHVSEFTLMGWLLVLNMGSRYLIGMMIS